MGARHRADPGADRHGGRRGTLGGRLQLVDNQVDARSGTVRVRAVFDNRDGRLMPGQFARVRLGHAKAEDAVLVSERAVGTDQDKKYVIVVGADNKVAYREVTLGASVDGLRIVSAGLKPGERVVVNGLQRVRPGALVAPQDAKTAMRRFKAARGGERRLDVRSNDRPDGNQNMNLSKFFIDRPIFAGVLSMLIFLAGAIAMRAAADLRVSRRGAAVGRRARDLSGRQPEGDRRDRGDTRSRSRSTASRTCSTWRARRPPTAC